MANHEQFILVLVGEGNRTTVREGLNAVEAHFMSDHLRKTRLALKEGLLAWRLSSVFLA